MNGMNPSAWAVKHRAVVLFLIIILVLAGSYSYVLLGRAEDPSFTVKQMVVQVAWPGATAEQMQDLVADPLEKRLQEFPELDFVRTYSRQGITVMLVSLKDYMRGPAVAETWYQVRKKLTDSRRELPEGVLGPFFNDEYGDVFSAIYMLTGEGLSRSDLKLYAEAMRKRLLRVPDVAKVSLEGEVDERVFIEFSNARLATLGLSSAHIIDAVRRQNVIAPAGAIETAADFIAVRVTGEFAAEAAIAETAVAAGGQVFRLGDIASVSRGYEDPPDFLVFNGGRPAVGLGVVMAANGNVLALGENLAKAVAEATADFPTGVNVLQIADQPKIVRESVGEFLWSFVEALAIVMAVSLVSLGFRAGLVVALAVPLVLAIVFVVMFLGGLNLDRITLGALIIALGLLVDDAIIAIEMMLLKMEEGLDRASAAAAAWDLTAFPMLTGTLVTAAGFLPVGFAKSTAGEYAGNIFTVVGLALLASWAVAVFFTPYLGYKLLRTPKHAGGGSHQSLPYRVLRRAVHWCLQFRFVVIGATLACFVAAGVGFGFVQQQFFPTSERSELFIEVTMPEGTSIAVTEAAARKAESLLKGDSDVLHFTTYVGAGSPRFFFALNPVLPNTNFALTVIMTKDAEARDRLKAKLQHAVAEGAVPEARVRIDQLVFGPPVGFPVQFRVMGDDPVQLREIAYQVRDIMRTEPSALNVQLDWNEQVKSVNLKVDHDRARALGLNQQDIAQSLQFLLSGIPVTDYREGNELIPVIARAASGDRANPSGLGDLSIMTASGHVVPMSQVASFDYSFEEPILWRRNRDLVLTVRADVAPGVQPATVTASILPKLDQLKSSLPAGYRIETGGAIEESAKANAALFSLFPAMFLVMLTLLMLQLQSFAKLFLVFSTAPLGVIGAVAALLAFNAPFGFVALLGVIALAGMIMRNTVILVDQIDHDLAAGADPWTAVVESTVRRARPVVLTALTAILALIPLARSVFWGPMAIAMIGGLMVATILTLVFLPALYAAWFRVKRPGRLSVPTGHTLVPAKGLEPLTP